MLPLEQNIKKATIDVKTYESFKQGNNKKFEAKFGTYSQYKVTLNQEFEDDGGEGEIEFTLVFQLGSGKRRMSFVGKTEESKKKGKIERDEA